MRVFCTCSALLPACVLLAQIAQDQVLFVGDAEGRDP